MALQGSYNYKGITLGSSYVKITQVNYSNYEDNVSELKTAAVYNSDGSLKTDAVYHDVTKVTHQGNWTAQIWKDKAARDAGGSWNNHVHRVNGSFTVDTKDSAKNPVVQAYAAMKADDEWKDYTDV